MILNDIGKMENEKRKIVKALMKATCSTESTVYRWINGQTKPPKAKRKIIAKVLKKPVEQLFPDD